MENGEEGVIVNTISTGGLNGAHAGVVYGASKHAVDGGWTAHSRIPWYDKRHI